MNPRRSACDHIAAAWAIVEGEGRFPHATVIGHLEAAIATLRGETPPAPPSMPAVVPAAGVKKTPKPKRPRLFIPNELPVFPPELLERFAATEAAAANAKRRRAIVVHQGVVYYRCSRDAHWAPEAWFADHTSGGKHSWCLRCMRIHTREAAAKLREKSDAAKGQGAAA